MRVHRGHCGHPDQQPTLPGFAETPDEPRGPNRDRALSAVFCEAAQCHARRAGFSHYLGLRRRLDRLFASKDSDEYRRAKGRLLDAWNCGTVPFAD